MAPAGDIRAVPMATRAAVICGAAFVVAAAGVSALQSTAPFARGWWLVAYLVLVGGLSQVLLVGGLEALASHAGARMLGGRAANARLVLWDAGTLMVAAMDLAEWQIGVLLGSAALAVALALFGHE